MARGFDDNQALEAERQALGKPLARRAKSACELCQATGSLEIIDVPPTESPTLERSLLVCESCATQIADPEQRDPMHWFCLQETIWSETPAVQVMTWRLLQSLKAEPWAQDLLDQAYLADDVMQWAQDGIGTQASGTRVLDSNGTELVEGDSVHLIKDLNVKGTTFTAKRGTLVKGIRLSDDPEYIEGRVNKTVIMLKTSFLKKAT